MAVFPSESGRGSGRLAYSDTKRLDWGLSHRTFAFNIALEARVGPAQRGALHSRQTAAILDESRSRPFNAAGRVRALWSVRSRSNQKDLSLSRLLNRINVIRVRIYRVVRSYRCAVSLVQESLFSFEHPKITHESTEILIYFYSLTELELGENRNVIPGFMAFGGFRGIITGRSLQVSLREVSVAEAASALASEAESVFSPLLCRVV